MCAEHDFMKQRKVYLAADKLNHEPELTSRSVQTEDPSAMELQDEFVRSFVHRWHRRPGACGDGPPELEKMGTRLGSDKRFSAHITHHPNFFLFLFLVSPALINREI